MTSRSSALDQDQRIQGPASIVKSALKNSNLLISHLINEPVSMIDPARPASLEFVLEWLRLTYAAKRIALRFAD